MAMPKKILVPTDFSGFSDKALEEAVEMAKRNRAKIYLFHVIPIIQQCAVDYCIDSAIVDDLEREAMQYSQDMMQKQIERVAKSGEVDIVWDIQKGTPYQGILREQEEKEIDLIVIATHGRTGLMGHLLGSVAEKVVKHAGCSVFLVRGK